MKTILFIILFPISVFTFGQKTKTIEVWTKPLSKEVINAVYCYDKNDSLIRIDIHFMGINSAYQYLTDYIFIFYGSPKSFYNFLTEVEKFYKENEPETTTQIQGHTVSLIKVMGSTGINIYELEGVGHRGFTLKGFSKFKPVFVEWAKENNVDLLE